MSNETNSSQQQSYEQPPEWASELLQCLTILESRVTNNDFNDPNVTIRKPGADFTPLEELLQMYPFLKNDFFRSPLSDSDRRTFLFDCPKNTLREYDPPKSLKINQSNHAKILDNHLYNIQYRLSGITRPLDWFAYRLHYHQWTEDQFKEHTMDLVESMYSLLSDLASHVTQIRQDNLYNSIPEKITHPILNKDNLITDPNEFLNHIKLQKSIQHATNKKSARYRPRSNNHFNNNKYNNYNGNTPGPNNTETFKKFNVNDKLLINNENILHLIIVAPKEKRKGLHITRNVAIHPHPSKALCPVDAYSEYVKRINKVKCITNHPIINTITLNRCFRHVLHPHKPLQSERISKYIQMIMKKVKRPNGAPIPKSRALASTLAAKAGVPIDDIVAHGHWSSRDIFEQFYRISAQGTNMTEETLNEQLISRTAKCNMM
ncbi:unnamed protein product [Cunninghamella blakesleeana]